MKRFLMQAAIVLVAASCVVMAQEQKPSDQPSVSPKVDTSGLLLEVRENRKYPPGYTAINGPGESSKWVWVTRFERIPGRKVPGKEIRAIRFEPVFNGETVDVKVTLLRGGASFEQEDPVGVYQVGIGERKTIGDLDQFGIEPIDIAISNTVPPIPPPPAFENSTKAIEIVSVRAENTPRPAYKLTLRNVSDKSIRAVRVETIRNGRRAMLLTFQGEEGRAFLEPGAVAERTVLATTSTKTFTGYAVGTPTDVTIKIATAVFADLSYDGELEFACWMESLVMSRRSWLKQVLPVLDAEIAKSNNDPVEAAKQFTDKLSGLSVEFDEGARKKDSSVSKACEKPALKAFMSNSRLDLIREVERITSAKSAQPVNFKSWMEETRARYSAWLARL